MWKNVKHHIFLFNRSQIDSCPRHFNHCSCCATDTPAFEWLRISFEHRVIDVLRLLVDLISLVCTLNNVVNTAPINKGIFDY